MMMIQYARKTFAHLKNSRRMLIIQALSHVISHGISPCVGADQREVYRESGGVVVVWRRQVHQTDVDERRVRGVYEVGKVHRVVLEGEEV